MVDIEYRVSNDQAARVTAEDFVVSVDISAYDLTRAPEPQQLPLGAEPEGGVGSCQSCRLRPCRADRVDVRSVPRRGGSERSRGLRSTTGGERRYRQVRGPASVVSQVDRAVAFVEIPASGINVNEPVPLTLVDIAGQPVGTGQLEVDPEVVSVQIEVRAVETETTVAVRPNIESGTPAPGFALEAIGVNPA